MRALALPGSYCNAIAIEQRLSALESALSVAQEAIAGLRSRVSELEASR